jgi:hypothetical protein
MSCPNCDVNRKYWFKLGNSHIYTYLDKTLLIIWAKIGNVYMCENTILYCPNCIEYIQLLKINECINCSNAPNWEYTAKYGIYYYYGGYEDVCFEFRPEEIDDIKCYKCKTHAYKIMGKKYK